jgi:type IV fimbrial biogenesis protein FimT
MYRNIHPFRSSRSDRGFTLIELLVTIGVASLLLAVAAPSFRDMSIRNRLTSYSNDLIATINVARSEAIRRGVPVVICRSDDQASCGGTWSDGWIAFVDANNDGIADDPVDEPVLTIYEGLTDRYTLNADAVFADSVTYGADGAADNIGMFAFCFEDELVGARAVALTRLRPRMALDTDGNRIPNRDDEADISSCDTPGG